MDRSEVLALQEAKREITQELQRIQKEYAKSLELLNDILIKLQNTRKKSTEETGAITNQLHSLEKKVEKTKEYFQKMQRAEQTLFDTEERLKVVQKNIADLQIQDRAIRQNWIATEKGIKAREKAVKNQEVIIQYEREQIERVKLQLDQKTIDLQKKEDQLNQRETDMEKEAQLRRTQVSS